MRFSHTLSTCKHYVSVSIIVLAMTLFLAGCPSPNDPAPNDSKPLLTITATQASVTEGATSTFTITRNNNEGALSVLLNISGSAEHNSDYTVDSTVNTDSSTGEKTMTVDFEGSKESVTITITAKNDQDTEANGETVEIEINESDDYTIAAPSTATLTIVDPAPSDAPSDAPVVSISTSGENNEVNEGERIIVTISSKEQVPNGLAVSLTIEGGSTATINADYTTSLDARPQSDIQTATVTIPGESTTVTFTIDAIDDGFDDIDESLIITIDPSNDYELADANNGSVTVTIKNDSDVDDDNNGLIEIRNLDMLRNVHFNLAGTSYDDEEDDVSGNGATGSTNGAPIELTDHCKIQVDGGVYLCGYELTRDLDFTDAGSYATGIIKDEWRPDPEDDSNDAINAGFPGIGAATGSRGFTGIFEGNGYSISNLYMRNTATQGYFTGLFRSTEAGAKIRNLDMINVAIYGGAGDRDRVGGLVGNNDGGTITASYATGDVDGGAGDADSVGGLVGYNRGPITASYASGTVDGGAGVQDRVGGLVGFNEGPITASYATGDVDGGAGTQDFVGGLVGRNNGVITASYASGTVDGGDGASDSVGGLVGKNDAAGTITASYASGTVDDGDGASDSVGGLVGRNNGVITASYASGTVDGGDGASDSVGGLVGDNNGGTITASYATGDVDGGAGSDNVGGLVGYNFNGDITASYATGTVDGGTGNSDNVGGLVGVHYNGAITASYATGTVDGRTGNSDNVGGLVGWNIGGTITASYGFGEATNVGLGSDGDTKPDNVTEASDLTKDNAGSEWNNAVSNTLGAWDFGNSDQNPALKYADYDGDAGSVYSCGPVPACGDLLPGQNR